MPTILFKLAPPHTDRIKGMMNQGVVFVVGTVTNAPSFELEVDDAASTDDIKQVIAGHAEIGWIGTEQPAP